jgi:glucose-6-phosphate 1-dehydrogenase
MTNFHSDALVFFGATGDLAYKKIFAAMVKREHLNVPARRLDLRFIETSVEAGNDSELDPCCRGALSSWDRQQSSVRTPGRTVLRLDRIIAMR